MAKNTAKPAPAFELGCPCCGAVLKIDPATQAVIAHTAATKPKMFADLEAAARSMKEQDTRKESLFQQSVQNQKNAAELLEKKFQEAIKRAKETPDTPHIRDFDLD
jgi:ribulose kinase